MRKFIMLVFAAMLIAQGCSRESQDSIKELGNDMKRDVNDAARSIDNKVQDAAD